MNIWECLRVAIRGLSNNKMRTALTMLGIIIGVGVVIIVVAIGQGAAARIADTINQLGTNLLTVRPGPPRIRLTAAVRNSADPTVSPGTVTTSTGATAGTSTGTALAPNRLTLEEANLIAKNFTKTIDAVAPQVRATINIRYTDNNASTSVLGTTTDYPYINNVEVDRGRFFTDAENEGSMKVCVVGITVAQKMTGDAYTDMTGMTLQINGLYFKVVGMQLPKGSNAWGQDQDDIVVMPIKTAMRRVLNRTTIDQMSIRCTSQTMMSLAQEQVENFLRVKHHLQPPYPDNDDFKVFNQTQLLQSQESVTGTMTSLLSAVAVISLVVGGIGIMNIMLVSVTERTREIGIRKAIGATPRDIMLQFLIEASIISLLGGLIGIILGVGGSKLLAAIAGWTTIVSTTAIGAALVVSAGVGLFFGIYPASKAAQLNPIDALRYE